MLICENCKVEFPSSIKIDNKIKYLHGRKYCLKCSPFNAHLTRSPVYKSHEGLTVICQVCQREYIYNRHNGFTIKYCISCIGTIKNRLFKQKCLDYKQNVCVICEYSKCPQAMQFHHINPEIKQFGIGQGANRSWEKTKKELDKCILVCSRCHDEIHAGYITLNRGDLYNGSTQSLHGCGEGSIPSLPTLN